jgi:bifunctional NMN adenylyltransferase/nudix hydrolase
MLYEFFCLSSSNIHCNCEVLPIVDLFNIPLWNNELDNQINSLTTKDDEVTLYGSRDSFIHTYTGKYTTKEISAAGDCSATQLREEIKKMDVVDLGEKFRMGVIWALRNEV